MAQVAATAQAMIFDRICQKWNFRQKRREKVEADDVIDVFGGIYVGLGTARVQGPALDGIKTLRQSLYTWQHYLRFAAIVKHLFF